MSMTAFDLEQDILKCWNITSDLGDLLDDLESGHMDIDEALKVMSAYRQVYERRFERCFRRFEQFNREVWEMRQAAVSVEGLDEPKNPAQSKGKKGKSKGQKEVDQ